MSETEKEPTLSEQLGALGCSLVLLAGGAAVAVSKWGDTWQIVGGIAGVIGLLTANATLWAILGRLWRGPARAPVAAPPAAPESAAPPAVSPSPAANATPAPVAPAAHGAGFCPWCGSELPPAAKFCMKCGKSLPA